MGVIAAHINGVLCKVVAPLGSGDYIPSKLGVQRELTKTTPLPALEGAIVAVARQIRVLALALPPQLVVLTLEHLPVPELHAAVCAPVLLPDSAEVVPILVEELSPAAALSALPAALVHSAVHSGEHAVAVEFVIGEVPPKEVSGVRRVLARAVLLPSLPATLVFGAALVAKHAVPISQVLLPLAVVDAIALRVHPFVAAALQEGTHECLAIGETLLARA
mmetsp:Transcript_15986/g.26798  ORF Transcript_15986/g.26798 Transcript_15986/m.26798 type:complete len:220 (+) Transcript_15986:1267-1926(+)